MEAVEDYINTGAAPAERMIRDLVACEVSHINTDHPSFIGGSRAIAVVMERRQQVGGHATLPLPPFEYPPCKGRTHAVNKDGSFQVACRLPSACTV